MMMPSYRPRHARQVKMNPTCAAMSHIRQAHSRLGIRTPRQDENLKHNHHIRLDAPDTPMDNHRRRFKTERRPKPDSDVCNGYKSCIEGEHLRAVESLAPFSTDFYPASFADQLFNAVITDC
jgi:hypothetical protein